eukprot:gene18810-25354_t
MNQNRTVNRALWTRGRSSENSSFRQVQPSRLVGSSIKYCSGSTGPARLSPSTVLLPRTPARARFPSIFPIPELCTPISSHPSAWDPQSARVVQNITLDAAFVPSDADPGTRLDYAHLAVLDDFLGAEDCLALFNFLAAPDHKALNSSDRHEDKEMAGCGPPSSKWERATSDGAGLPRTWGLKDAVLHEFAASKLHAKIELQSRLAKLYPEYIIGHMPSDSLQNLSDPIDPIESGLKPGQACPHSKQGPASNTSIQTLPDALHAKGGSKLNSGQASPYSKFGPASNASIHDGPEASGDAGDAQLEDPESVPSSLSGPKDKHANDAATAADDDGVQPEDPESTYNTFDCHNILANATVYGDSFAWHVDADPWTLPESAWTHKFGHYFNREPGKPLFDTPTDTGIFVRPKAGRIVLMDQDVVHRLSTPSKQANRPRYSVVWKLIFFPTCEGQSVSLAKPEWGPPTSFGSAARAVQAVKTMAALKNKKRRAEHLVSEVHQDGL